MTLLEAVPPEVTMTGFELYIGTVKEALELGGRIGAARLYVPGVKLFSVVVCEIVCLYPFGPSTVTLAPAGGLLKVTVNVPVAGGGGGFPPSPPPPPHTTMPKSAIAAAIAWKGKRFLIESIPSAIRAAEFLKWVA